MTWAMNWQRHTLKAQAAPSITHSKNTPGPGFWWISPRLSGHRETGKMWGRVWVEEGGWTGGCLLRLSSPTSAVDCDRIGPRWAGGKIMNGGVCVSQRRENMCYEVISLGAGCVCLSWNGWQLPDPHPCTSLHAHTHTHSLTSFPSAPHFRLIGLATATAGWGLRHEQLRCVCWCVYAAARGLASPPGTCHINPIPDLLNWVNEQSLPLLWDRVPLAQSGAGLGWWVQR